MYLQLWILLQQLWDKNSWSFIWFNVFISTDRCLPVTTFRFWIWEKPWNYWRQTDQMQAATAVKPSTLQAAQRKTLFYTCWVRRDLQQHVDNDAMDLWALVTVFVVNFLIYIYFCLSPTNICGICLFSGCFSNSQTRGHFCVQSGRVAFSHSPVVQRQKVSGLWSERNWLKNSTFLVKNCCLAVLFLFFSRPIFLADPNLEVTNRGQFLRIKSARLGDQAQYQCSVTNAAGKQSKDFNLSVYSE